MLAKGLKIRFSNALIKRQQALKEGFDEFDLICLSYNIRRSVSILGVKPLLKTLRAFKTALFHLFKSFSANNRRIDATKAKYIHLKNINSSPYCFA